MCGIEVVKAGANLAVRLVSCRVQTTPFEPKPSAIMMVSCCGNNMQKENEELVEKCANATHPQSLSVQKCDVCFFPVYPQKKQKAR